jgi:hypothetical protein
MKRVFLYSPNVPQLKKTKKNKKKESLWKQTNKHTIMGLGEFGCEYKEALSLRKQK